MRGGGCLCSHTGLASMEPSLAPSPLLRHLRRGRGREWVLIRAGLLGGMGASSDRAALPLLPQGSIIPHCLCSGYCPVPAPGRPAASWILAAPHPQHLLFLEKQKHRRAGGHPAPQIHGSAPMFLLG